MMPEVSYLAVLLCGVSAMILGSLWYGPLFGKPWMAMMGYTPEKIAAGKNDPKAKQAMMRSYALMFLGSLVTAYVLSHVWTFATAYMKVSGPASGISVGFWSWLGFVGPISMGTVLWENKPWKLWYINSGYWLVQLCVMGVIVAAMN